MVALGCSLDQAERNVKISKPHDVKFLVLETEVKIVFQHKSKMSSKQICVLGY